MNDHILSFYDYLVEERITPKQKNKEDVITRFINKHTELKSDEEKILSIVSIDSGISPFRIKSRTRKREVVKARQIAMYFISEYTKNSLSSVGMLLSLPWDEPYDHATVLHSKKTVEDLKFSNRKYREELESMRIEIEKQLNI